MDEAYRECFGFNERHEWERDDGQAGGGLVSDVLALCRIWNCDALQLFKQLRADRENAAKMTDAGCLLTDWHLKRENNK